MIGISTLCRKSRILSNGIFYSKYHVANLEPFLNSDELIIEFRKRIYDWIPKSSTYIHDNYLKERFSKTYKLNDEIGVSVIYPENQELNERAFSYITETFYKDGPIPRCLQIMKNPDDQRVKKFIRREFDTQIESKLSFLIHNHKANKDSGISINSCWALDPNYKCLKSDLKTWLNCASEIANQTKDETLRVLIFRNYQYQYIYNLAQSLLRIHNKTWYIHFSILYFDQEIRNNSLSSQLLSDFIKKIDDKGINGKNDLIYGFQSNFDKFIPISKNIFSRDSQELDQCDYDEINLLINNQPAFRQLSKFGKISFHANI